MDEKSLEKHLDANVSNINSEESAFKVFFASLYLLNESAVTPPINYFYICRFFYIWLLFSEIFSRLNLFYS